jgi:hypothetical protein
MIHVTLRVITPPLLDTLNERSRINTCLLNNIKIPVKYFLTDFGTSRFRLIKGTKEGNVLQTAQ